MAGGEKVSSSCAFHCLIPVLPPCGYLCRRNRSNSTENRSSIIWTRSTPRLLTQAWYAGKGGAKPWREIYSKHTKAFIRVGRPKADRSWSEPVGMALEIVPEKDPTTLRAGDEFPVRVLRNGAPLADFSLGIVREGPSNRLQEDRLCGTRRPSSYRGRQVVAARYRARSFKNRRSPGETRFHDDVVRGAVMKGVAFSARAPPTPWVRSLVWPDRYRTPPAAFCGTRPMPSVHFSTHGVLHAGTVCIGCCIA